MDRWKAVYAQDTNARTLADVIDGADVFLGLSAGGVLKPEHVKRMARDPLIMALANPVPEIMPELANEARPDAMICTGRSDYPNQVNNVLCFPYIFRGALDVGATEINEAMKHAAVKAIAALAREAPSDVVARAYGGEAAPFGRASLIPSPFDPRLIMRIAPAVARAAMESGVARRPIADFDAYADRLSRFVFRSGLMMKPLFAKARAARKRVIYAEGEDERVLRATQVVLEERLAEPILIGRPEVIRERIRRYGLHMTLGKDFENIDPESDPRYRDYVATYLKVAGRKGVTPDAARTLVRTNTTVIGALALHRGEADALICGLEGRFAQRLKHIKDIVGLAPGATDFAALSLVIAPTGVYFLADTHVRYDPTALEIADLAFACADHVRRFGMTPKIALVSHSDFGAADTPSARKMREALKLVGQPQSRFRDRRRNAGRHRAVAGGAGAGDRRLQAQRRSERADLPQPRRRQHRAAADPRDRRRAADRADPDRTGQAGARADPVGDRARHRQHDCDRRHRGGGAVLSCALIPRRRRRR